MLYNKSEHLYDSHSLTYEYFRFISFIDFLFKFCQVAYFLNQFDTKN
jgi:hypothetical protein